MFRDVAVQRLYGLLAAMVSWDAAEGLCLETLQCNAFTGFWLRWFWEMQRRGWGFVSVE